AAGAAAAPSPTAPPPGPGAPANDRTVGSRASPTRPQMPAPFTLQFPAVDLPALASRYTDPGDPRMDDIGDAARQRGHLTRDELLELVAWKSGGRQLHNARKNTPASVEEITAVALTAADERLRIGALLCLDGVSWPTASAILHFAHAEAYPLLDQRAL